MEHIKNLCLQYEFQLISLEEFAACLSRLVPDHELRVMYVEELISSDQSILDLVV